MNMVFIWCVYSLKCWNVIILLNPNLSDSIFPDFNWQCQKCQTPLIATFFFLRFHDTYLLVVPSKISAWVILSLPITKMLDFPNSVMDVYSSHCLCSFWFIASTPITLIIIHVAITLKSVPLAQLSSLCIRHICQWLVYISN